MMGGMVSNTAAPRIAMVGVGSMSGAILSGLLAREGSTSGTIAVTTKSAASAAKYSGEERVVAFAQETEPEANRKAVEGADVVVLGVKPWMVHDVLRDISESLVPGTILVSVAAGVLTEGMQALVPEGVIVTRAMPNTPSFIGRGVTGVYGGPGAHEAAVATVRGIFETVGDVIVVERESQIDDVAAVSGSGPAYVYLFAEAMTGAAERLGFSPDDARRLVQGTIAGAAELMVQSDLEPSELRRNVTSPKGTTEQAILVLEQGDWQGLFDRALAANVRRSQEIAAGE